MTRIERKTVEADIFEVTVPLYEALATVMTGLAEGLQRTKQECIPIAAMRFDVVRNGSWFHYAALQAKGAKRMVHQLPAPALLPSH